MSAMRSAALTAGGQPQTALRGARKIRAARTTSWKRKQPRPGPRAASSGSPLYWTFRTLDGPSGWLAAKPHRFAAHRDPFDAVCRVDRAR